MAWTEADLTTIELGISEGQRIVKLDGRLVEYQTMQGMLDARDAIKEDLRLQGIDAGTRSRRPAVYRIRQTKGL